MHLGMISPKATLLAATLKGTNPFPFKPFHQMKLVFIKVPVSNLYFIQYGSHWSFTVANLHLNRFQFLGISLLYGFC